ncbi:hypothetical protein MUK42_25245 [Musa troglodytarum]|uniref:Uncharacterized protein n=1 Tax=Musa troglodytarum TaxID=320322 RepID=A0A9E7GA76_9LILI|nr:hypothetical protein MUK42_25245 [Musa troglodytarum]
MRRLTLYFLQYSGSLQCDSLSGETKVTSYRYLMEEQEEVRTTRLTEFALEQDLNTFLVPSMAGSTSACCQQLNLIDMIQPAQWPSPVWRNNSFSRGLKDTATMYYPNKINTNEKDQGYCCRRSSWRKHKGPTSRGIYRGSIWEDRRIFWQNFPAAVYSHITINKKGTTMEFSVRAWTWTFWSCGTMTGDAVWNTPSTPSTAKSKLPSTSRSALTSFSLSLAPPMLHRNPTLSTSSEGTTRSHR